MDSEVTTLLLNKTLYNEGQNKESFSESSFGLGRNWEWDQYYDSDFDFEFHDTISLKEEARKSEHLISIHDLNLDEKSTPTILTSDEIELETSEQSKESSIDFRDIDISDSQLKIPNVFDSYPIPADPGIDAAFWYIFQKENNKDDYFNKYIDLTKKLKLRPISCLKEMFTKDEFNLRYHGLNPKSLRAISEALVDDVFVSTLILEDNWLTVDACFHLNEFLLKNTFIVTLNLSECRLGAAGAKRIEEGLMTVPSLLNLNLSHCELGDEGLSNLCSGISLNESLESLDLSGNQLSGKCAKNLEEIILRSQTLIRLNLSWNSLHDKEILKVIFNSLANNGSMEEINLSWNGIGSDSLSHISTFLSKSSNLKILNLSWNQFVDIGKISNTLSKNSNLEELYIGNNPLKRTEVLNLIESLTLQEAPESKLRVLNLENIWVEKKVLSTLETIENTKPWLDIKLGGILSNFKLIGPNVKHLLLKRANFEAINTKKKNERKDFGHFILTLEDTSISFKKFSELVKNFKLKLSDNLITAIAKSFAVNKNLVDQGELKSFYLKEYPDTVLPPEKTKKIKKEKKEKKRKKEKKGKKEKNDKDKKTMKPKKEIQKKELKSKKMVKKELRFQESSLEDFAEDFQSINSEFI